jgi:hypothetical protein
MSCCSTLRERPQDQQLQLLMTRTGAELLMSLLTTKQQAQQKQSWQAAKHQQARQKLLQWQRQMRRLPLLLQLQLSLLLHLLRCLQQYCSCHVLQQLLQCELAWHCCKGMG